jgi:hypothetical protein
MRAGKRDPRFLRKARELNVVEISPRQARVSSFEPTVARRVAVAAIAAGVALMLIAQRLAPIAGPPLYDGVIVTDPYRWLSPPPGGLGGAQGATETEPVQGESPVVAIATPEEPPQAQIFAAPGSLVPPPNTSSLRLSIEPVQPGTAPTDGVIDGNEYKIDVLNQAGLPVAGRVGGQVTVVLRGPPNGTAATVERFSNGTWQPLPTDPAGLPDTFIAVVTDFGLFALVAPAPAATPLAPPAPAPSNSSKGAVTTPAQNSTADTAGGAGQSSNSGPSYPGYLTPLLAVICLAVMGAGVVLEVRWYRRHR